MNGTTRCPHCETSFKIAEGQLSAHHGMVRCGNCLQAFDARPNYLPEQTNPQLDLPIGEAITTDTDSVLVTEPTEESPPQEVASNDAIAVEALACAINTETDAALDQHSSNLNDTLQGELPPTDQSVSEAVTTPGEVNDTLDFSHIPTSHARHPDKHAPEQTIDIPNHVLHHSEQGTSWHDEESTPPKITRLWAWMSGIAVLSTLLVLQSVYFYRVGLAAHLPAIKPALLAYCQLINCSVPLPQHAELLSIESSSLDANAAQENQITLNILMRNRADYTLAFPVLALTLNDNQDQPVARRLFPPSAYLPSDENELKGMRANHEIVVKLALRTSNLKASGYRLELFYSKD